jgi:hypothetical protein
MHGIGAVRQMLAFPHPGSGGRVAWLGVAREMRREAGRRGRISGIERSSGGNLGNGRTRTAMYTDSIEQLRGTAGARQVRVRAETALAAFTTPSNGGWIMFGKHPS